MAPERSDPARGAGRRPVALVGTTASGKSALALVLARDDPTIEIVSVDSMQVYRGMDVGTAKPTPAERAAVPHHLIDLAEPSEEFTLARFAGEARRAIDQIVGRRHRPLLVGGTGLYLRSVVDDLVPPGRFPDARVQVEAEPDTHRLHRRLAELDPVAAGRMEPTNRRRIVRALEVTLGSGRPFSSFGPGLEAYPPTPFLLVGIELPTEVVDERIAERVRRQVAEGFVDEVRRLHDHRRGLSHTAAQALGYKEIAAHLAGECSLDEALDLVVRRTRRFARRQRSWFRRDPRITWVRGPDPDALLAGVREVLARQEGA